MSEGLANTGDERVARLLAELGVAKDLRLSEEFLAESLGLLTDHPDTLDLKIATSAIAEMRDAFAMFAPYKDVRKVSIFGSARTTKDDPLYEQARAAAHGLAAAGWMVVTGAGPGIMEAGMLGAGREQSIGVSIQLPFETAANFVIAGDAKHVSMKYFFTRKLMLVKESSAFVCLPGGFGTLDETFELLTLTQTGKGVPVPIVFLDTPGDEYWEAVDEFVQRHLVARGLVSPLDRSLYCITDDHQVAVREIERFYANYHSARYIGDDLVIRMHHGPTDEQLADLTARFGKLAVDGQIRRVEPYGIERRQNDNVGLARIAFAFDRHGYSSLRGLIDAINELV
jgi:uncharacterized protein (TIGR00730 family)